MQQVSQPGQGDGILWRQLKNLTIKLLGQIQLIEPFIGIGKPHHNIDILGSQA